MVDGLCWTVLLLSCLALGLGAGLWWEARRMAKDVLRIMAEMDGDMDTFWSDMNTRLRSVRCSDCRQILSTSSSAGARDGGAA